MLIVINYLATHFNDVIRNQAAMNGYPMMKQVDSENPRQVRTLRLEHMAIFRLNICL